MAEDIDKINFVLQRFNSVLLHDSFIDDDRPEYVSLPNIFYIVFAICFFLANRGFPS